MNRRKFSKLIGLTIIAESCPGASGVRWASGAVAPEDGNVGRLILPLDAVPELRAIGASARVGLSPLRGNGSQLKPENQKFYPILITRQTDSEFFAVESNCTHASFVVDRVTGSDFLRCPVHGSVFGLDGARRTGPATADLQRFETCFDPDAQALTVLTPFTRYTLEIEPTTTPTERLKIRFTARFSLRYQILRQSQFGADWTPVPFALTESGPLNRTELVTDGFDRKVDVFVEPTVDTEFYEVHAMAKGI